MDTAVYLQEHGIKPSYQRVRILEYMMTRKNHPTADMIYEELSKDIPTLSRTTVYNTVNLFLQNGLIQKIGIDEQEVRYDADITFHAHFKCDNCGEIWDLPVKDGKLDVGGLDNFKVREVQYYVKGLCPKCL
jgi:Fe2+ or Zn2+ uptake regulation protein